MAFDGNGNNITVLGNLRVTTYQCAQLTLLLEKLEDLFKKTIRHKLVRTIGHMFSHTGHSM